LVRLNNGAAQTVTFAADPGYRVGDKVKINDGAIVRNPDSKPRNSGNSQHGCRE